MRRSRWLLLVLVLLLVGCVSQEMKDLVHRNYILQTSVERAVDMGTATQPDLEQNVRANALCWKALDELFTTGKISAATQARMDKFIEAGP